VTPIIPSGQDDTLKHRREHPRQRQQIIQRAEHPRPRGSGRRLEVRPRRRDQRPAPVRQRQDQLKPAATAHPPDQGKRAAFPRVTRAHDPHPPRKAVEVGSVSCLPSTGSTTRR
jgi:hypothetical protein